MNILGAHVKGKSDGLTGAPTDGQIARYNATNKQWEAYTMTAADIVFVPGASGLVATNLQDAMLEVFDAITP